MMSVYPRPLASELIFLGLFIFLLIFTSLSRTPVQKFVDENAPDLPWRLPTRPYKVSTSPSDAATTRAGEAIADTESTQTTLMTSTTSSSQTRAKKVAIVTLTVSAGQAPVAPTVEAETLQTSAENAATSAVQDLPTIDTPEQKHEQPTDQVQIQNADVDASTPAKQEPEPEQTQTSKQEQEQKSKEDVKKDPTCGEIPGAKDTVLIIKTGSTVMADRLPVRLRTSMKCFPNTLIFSDVQEDFQGVEINDALEDVIEDVRLHHNDFALYRKLLEKGRKGLTPDDFGRPLRPDNIDDAAASEGWRLDRFKFLPAAQKSYERFPDAKWFIFTDADSYVSFSNVHKWLDMMDHKKDLYIGSQATSGSTTFGHGGSAFVLSQSAMKKISENYKANQTRWDKSTAEAFFGDVVMARALLESDIHVTSTYPILQGEDPRKLDFLHRFGYDRRVWCYPAVSFHHVVPETTDSLFEFEQRWFKEMPDTPMRFSDVFHNWLLPQVNTGERVNWDNGADCEVGNFTEGNREACQAHCERDKGCLQWAEIDGRCKTSSKVTLGEKALGRNARSGWMTQRFEFHSRSSMVEQCKEGDWILPK